MKKKRKTNTEKNDKIRKYGYKQTNKVKNVLTSKASKQKYFVKSEKECSMYKSKVFQIYIVHQKKSKRDDNDNVTCQKV